MKKILTVVCTILFTNVFAENKTDTNKTPKDIVGVWKATGMRMGDEKTYRTNGPKHMYSIFTKDGRLYSVTKTSKKTYITYGTYTATKDSVFVYIISSPDEKRAENRLNKYAYKIVKDTLFNNIFIGTNIYGLPVNKYFYFYQLKSDPSVLKGINIKL